MPAWYIQNVNSYRCLLLERRRKKSNRIIFKRNKNKKTLYTICPISRVPQKVDSLYGRLVILDICYSIGSIWRGGGIGKNLKLNFFFCSSHTQSTVLDRSQCTPQKFQCASTLTKKKKGVKIASSLLTLIMLG